VKSTGRVCIDDAPDVGGDADTARAALALVALAVAVAVTKDVSKDLREIELGVGLDTEGGETVIREWCAIGSGEARGEGAFAVGGGLREDAELETKAETLTRGEVQGFGVAVAVLDEPWLGARESGVESLDGLTRGKLDATRTRDETEAFGEAQDEGHATALAFAEERDVRGVDGLDEEIEDVTAGGGALVRGDAELEGVGLGKLGVCHAGLREEQH